MDRSDIRAQDVGFEAGIAALYPRLFQLALRLCRNHADARDLAQDAVERGLRHRVLFRTQGSPDRWMFTILRRIFVDELPTFTPGPGYPQGAVDDTTVVAPNETFQPSVGTYALYRAADHVELHLNTSVLNSADLPMPHQSTTSAEIYTWVLPACSATQ